MPSKRPPRGLRLQGSTFVSAAVVLICLVLFVWPIVMIIQGAFVDGQPGVREGWTFAPFVEVYTSPQTLESFRNSVVLAASVTLCGLLLAFYFAWLVARTDTPLRGFITPTMLAVLAIPPLFFGISWSLLGNQSTGLLNGIIQTLTGSDITPVNIESFGGLIFVSILKSAAFGYFLLLGPMRATSRAMEEAASVAGARRIRVVLGINVPVLSPALLSALVLGFILGLEYFELPLLLASPAGVRLISTDIYNYLNDLTPPGYAQASSLSIVLLVVLLVMLVIQQRVLGKRNFQTVSGKNVNTDPWRLGQWRYFGTAVFILYTAFALVLPLVQLGLTSLLPYLGASSGFTFRNYIAVLNNPQAITSLRNTAMLSVLGGLFVMLLALGIIYVIRRTRPRWIGQAISRSTWLPWATPGTALALGILWVVLSVPFATELYGTLAIMLVGLVIVAAPIAMRSIDSAVDQIGDELEEAAWVSGAGRLRAFGVVVVRLIIPSFLGGWLLTGILISGNLVMPLLVGASTLRSVPKLTYDLYTNGQAPRAAAFACMVLVGLLAVYALGLVAKWSLARLLPAGVRRTPEPSRVPVGAGAPSGGR